MEREKRFIMMVQMILNGADIGINDALNCLDDACFYANTHASDIMTKSCPDLAQNFVNEWYRKNPEYVRSFRGT